MEIIINNVIDDSDLDMSTMDGSSVVWLNDRLCEPQTLYLQLLDLEYQCRPISEENVIKIFASILDRENFPLETKAKMSQRKLEFLEDFCASITTYVSSNFANWL